MQATVHIHHFFPHPDTGHVELDEEGDPQIGYYFQFIDNEGEPISRMVGPYGTLPECEAACCREYVNGDL
jgi:hypothetical protein